MGNSPFVSIIIPCRNEEKFIAKCLDCVLHQDYPKDRTEILIADGMSIDGTRKILEEYSKKFPQVLWFDNLSKISAAGLNVLIRQSHGEVIVRLDAHTNYPNDYVSKCVRYLFEYEVDNVGGVCITMPGNNTWRARAIAKALSSKFGVGDSMFRTGLDKPTLTDTVPFGCFKRQLFDRVGGYDEDLPRAEDSEFNHRIIKNGGKILLVPDIVSNYYARETFGKLARMYAQYGYFKAFTTVKLGGVYTFRQLIPAIFVFSIFVLSGLAIISPILWSLLWAELIAYTATNILFSAKLSLKEGEIRLFPSLMVSFCLIHLFFGFNYLRGILDFWIIKKHLSTKISDLPLTR